MRLTLLAVGRLNAAHRELAAQYLKRLGRYAEVVEREVREAGKAPNAEEERRLEGARLREAFPPRALRVALDRSGRAWTSEELADQLGRWRDGGRDPLFVIGGSQGLDPSVLEASDLRWSLGPLTLPHQLARVVVLEQLYRGWTILRGEKYHK